MKLSLFRLMATAIALSTSSAAPANPMGRLYDQPDGSTTPEIFLKGDQHYSWKTDKKGYSVIQDAQGWWVYAKQEDGLLVSSGVRVGYGNPKKVGLTTNLKVGPSKRINNLRHEEDVTREHRDLLQIPTSALCNFQGTKDNPCRLKALVVLIRLANHASRKLPSPEEYDILFNHNGPTADGTAPTGSVADVFRGNSFDSFVLESHITDWTKVSRTETQTVDGNNGLNMAGTKATWKEAMERVENTGLDFRQFDEDGDGNFDCLVIMHSGAAAETGGNDCETNTPSEKRIWSHATTQTWFTSKRGISNSRFYVAAAVWDTCPRGGKGAKWEIARIAVIAHECSHFLGLPDTYDTEGGTGLGSFDLLANMWGWLGTQYFPPLMTAWCKYKLGWVNAIRITTSDTYTLRQACTSNEVYLIDYNMPNGEYYLIENRYPCGFDSELKAQGGNRGQDNNGIAVWHVDETGSQSEISHQSEGRPGDAKYPRQHYLVALIQGDGEYDLEKGLNRGDNGDLFRASSVHPDAAYKIGPNGVVLNNGRTRSNPNTNSYGKGVEKKTGISIEFGPPDSSTWIKVNLQGAPSGPVTTDVARNRPTECTASLSTVCFTFNGKVYNKKCRVIEKIKAQTCNLLNHKTGGLVRDRCSRQCGGVP